MATTPTASGTVLNFRRFPGNFFSTGRIVQNWSVRGKGTINGTPCVTGWGHASSWNSLSFFGWQSLLFNMSSNFDPTAEQIQVRHRTSDWQWIAQAAAPTPFVPGPGPYTDRTRIGRQVLTGPVINEGIDSRSQGQDCFPTEISPVVTPAGEHYRPYDCHQYQHRSHFERQKIIGEQRCADAPGSADRLIAPRRR